MKFRESHMPEEEHWNSFFNPEKVLRDLGLAEETGLMVDVGSGYGTFAIPAARLIRGKVIGLDIEPELIANCRRKAAQLGLTNAVFMLRDVFAQGLGIPDGSADCILLFNILHCEEPLQLLHNSYRALKEGGRVLIIHWKYDETTPRGPSMEIRPRPPQIIEWARQVNFELAGETEIEPYHYGLVFRK